MEIEMSEVGWMMRIRTSWSECLLGREAAGAHLLRSRFAIDKAVSIHHRWRHHPESTTERFGL